MKKFDDNLEKLAQFKVKCKHCGHVVIMINKKKDICNWCGYYIYRSKKDEFEERLRSEMKK